MAEDYTPSLSMRLDQCFSDAYGYWPPARAEMLKLIEAEREKARQEERSLLEYEHVESVAYTDDVAEGYEGPVPDDYTRHYCEADGEDWPCAYAQHDEKARQEERERCARIAEDAPGTTATGYYSSGDEAGYREAQDWIAARIRGGD